jgi:hypothetical protein
LAISDNTQSKILLWQHFLKKSLPILGAGQEIGRLALKVECLLGLTWIAVVGFPALILPLWNIDLQQG